MKIILKIAKLELSSMFYSPVAWLLLLIFLFQSGMSFTSFLENIARDQKLGYFGNIFTETIFSSNPGGMFTNIQGNLYLYIPLLTMGLLSREISSGSIKLLFSSPVRISEIVIGKFLAMAMYGLILIFMLLLFVAAGFYALESPDIQLIVSGLIGLYLLICAYSAIGLFMSALTPYQVVAAISTLVILALLKYIGAIGRGIDVVRDVTYYLSISGRCDQLISGLISSKDVFYFMIVTGFFLGLTILKLQSDRESGSRIYKLSRYAVLLLLAVGLISLTSLSALTGYVDMTENKRQTLTVNSKEAIAQLKGPVNMTVYVNLLDFNAFLGMPTNRMADIRQFEQYKRFLPDLSTTYVYYYDKSKNADLYKQNPGLNEDGLAKLMTETFDLDLNDFLKPEEIRRKINLFPEENRLVRQLEYKGKKVFLRMFDDMEIYPNEQEVTAAFKRLVQPSPKVLFLTGNGERSLEKIGDAGYHSLTTQIDFRYALINQGFNVDTLSLTGGVSVPDSIAVLVIADPVKAYSQDNLKRVHEYISRGGNLLVFGEPGRQDIINSFLNPIGAKLGEGMLAQKSKDFPPGFILSAFREPDASSAEVLRNFFLPQGKISMRGAGSVSYTDTGSFKFYPVLVTDKSSTWNKRSPFNPDSEEIRYDAKQGDSRLEFPVAVAATRQLRNKEQRIFILGDADVFSNAELGRKNISTMNFALSTNLFKWFSYGAFPVDTSRPAPADNKVNIHKEDVFWLRILFLILVPAVVIAGGLTILIKRQRR